MAEGGADIPQPKQTAKPDEKKAQVTLNRRQFLQAAGATALKLAFPASAPANPPENATEPPEDKPAPSENKPDATEGKFQLGEYVERDPIPFPTWAVPVFEPLWQYMDEIGKNFGIDPRIIMGYMAMESKGDMFAGSKREGGAKGVMQIIPGPSTSEGWHNQLIHEKRYYEIVDNLRKVGIEIADAQYNPYPIVLNTKEPVKPGENNLYSVFELVLAAYKLWRDWGGEKGFVKDDLDFIAHIPDNPTSYPTYAKLEQRASRIIGYYLGGDNGLYRSSVLGHIAPFDEKDSTKLSPHLITLYTGPLYAGRRENGMDGSINAVVESQTSVAIAQNSNVKAHPQWGAPLMMIPKADDMKSKWNQVQKTYNLLQN